jgi:hypothetical protein
MPQIVFMEKNHETYDFGAIPPPKKGSGAFLNQINGNYISAYFGGGIVQTCNPKKETVFGTKL